MINKKAFEIEEKASEKAQKEIDKITKKNDIDYLVEQYAEAKNEFIMVLREVSKRGDLGNDKEQYRYYYLKYMEEWLGDMMCNLLLDMHGYERNKDNLFEKKKKKR